jgi:hypothetical protein
MVGCAAETDQAEVEATGIAQALATRTVEIEVFGFAEEKGVYFDGMVTSLEVGGQGGIPNTVRLKFQTTSEGYQRNWAELSIVCESRSDGAQFGDTREYGALWLPAGEWSEPAFFCPTNFKLISAYTAVNLTSP